MRIMSMRVCSAGRANERAEGSAGTGGVGPEPTQPLSHGPHLAPLVLSTHLPTRPESGAAAAQSGGGVEVRGSLVCKCQLCICLLEAESGLRQSWCVWRLILNSPYMPENMVFLNALISKLLM